MNRFLFILILACIGWLLAHAQPVPPPVYGPPNKSAKVLTPATETITLRPWRNVPAPFSTPTNVSTNALKMGWQGWSRSDAFNELSTVSVTPGKLTNWVLYSMGMVWNPLDTYSEFDPVLWQYFQRMNLGKLVTNREVDRISYPQAVLNVSTGAHAIHMSTNLRDWALVANVIGPTQMLMDIDERKPVCVWRVTP